MLLRAENETMAFVDDWAPKMRESGWEVKGVGWRGTRQKFKQEKVEAVKQKMLLRQFSQMVSEHALGESESE